MRSTTSHPFWHAALPSNSATAIRHQRASAIVKDGANRRAIWRDPTRFNPPPPLLPPKEMADDSFVSTCHLNVPYCAVAS